MDKCRLFFQVLEKNGADFRWEREMRDNLLRIEEVSDFITHTVKAFLGRDAISLPRRLGVNCERSLGS